MFPFLVAIKGAVLTAEGSYESGPQRRAPHKAQGIKVAGRWRVSYSSVVLKNPGVAFRRYGGLLNVFKSLIKEPLLPPPITVVVQWTWTHWLEDYYSSYLDSGERLPDGEGAATPLSLVNEERDIENHCTDGLKLNFDLADSIAKKLDGNEIDGVDAIEAIELAVQWGAMTECTLDESLKFSSLNPLKDRYCRWFTSARWSSWAEGPGPFSRSASALLKAVYATHGLTIDKGHQPMSSIYDAANVGDKSTHACLEALSEDWLDEMMKEVLDRKSYPPDPRPYPYGPVLPHTPSGRSLWTWMHQNGSPVGRLFSRFSNHLAGLVDVGGVEVVSVAWARLMWEMRSFWEERVSIPGMLPLPIVDGVDMLDPLVNGQATGVQQHLRYIRAEKPVANPDIDPVLNPPEPDPDLRLGSITQLLMLVNNCIGGAPTPIEGFNNDSERKAGVDDSDRFKPESIENSKKNSLVEDDDLYCNDDVPHDSNEPAIVPPKLPPLCPLVDHVGYEQTAIVLYAMRSVLVADMEAFLRSNPEATCYDFCVWYGLRPTNNDEELSIGFPNLLRWNEKGKEVIFIPKERQQESEGYRYEELPPHEAVEVGNIMHSSHLTQKTIRFQRDEGEQLSGSSTLSPVLAEATPPSPDEHLHHVGLAKQDSEVVVVVSHESVQDFPESCSDEQEETEIDCGEGGLEAVKGELSTACISIAACWAEANKNMSTCSVYSSSNCSLFNPSVEAEKALHLLETTPSSKVCIEALGAFLASADFVLCMTARRLGLIESFSCVKESLCDLRQWMERVDNSNACNTELNTECVKVVAERLVHGCELLEIAEGCIERATAIRNSYPQIVPHVSNNLASYPCTRHVELPNGPEGLSAVSKLGKVVCGFNWERHIVERGGIPPPPNRREYILSCSLASGLRHMGRQGWDVEQNDETSRARMHAIVIEPSQSLRNAAATCQVRISTAIPEPEAMTVDIR